MRQHRAGTITTGIVIAVCLSAYFAYLNAGESCDLTYKSTKTNSTTTGTPNMTSVTTGNSTEVTRIHANHSSYCLATKFLQDWGNLWSLVVGVAGVLIGAYLSPRIKEQFDIRAQYKVPFTKWCSEFYGTLFEFSQLCTNIEFKKPLAENNAHLIFHLYEMHRGVEEGYKWLGQVRKEREEVAEHLDDLFDGVDQIWHSLENDDWRIIGKQSSPDDFRLILRGLLPEELDIISENIRSGITKENFFKDEIPVVEYFLYSKIPERSRFGAKLRNPEKTKHRMLKIYVNDASLKTLPETLQGKAFLKLDITNTSQEYVEIHGFELKFTVYGRTHYLDSDPCKEGDDACKNEEEKWKGKPLKPRTSQAQESGPVEIKVSFSLDTKLEEGQIIKDAKIHVYHSFGRAEEVIDDNKWSRY